MTISGVSNSTKPGDLRTWAVEKTLARAARMKSLLDLIISTQENTRLMNECRSVFRSRNTISDSYYNQRTLSVE